MKSMNRLWIAALAALTVGSAALAQEKKAPKTPAAPKFEKCIVTDEELGSMGKPIEIAYTGKNAAYKGKKVAVCCGGCVGKVNKEQDKFFKKFYGVAKAAPAKAAKPAPKG